VLPFSAFLQELYTEYLCLYSIATQLILLERLFKLREDDDQVWKLSIKWEIENRTSFSNRNIDVDKRRSRG